MTDEERNKLAVDAALAFMEAEPAFIAIPDNSKIIVGYLEQHPELSPVEVSSYRQAFSACRDRLRFEHQMSAQEFKEAVVIPAWQKKQQDKPIPSETDVMLKQLFESRGFRDSVKNRAKVGRYMKDHDIDDYSPDYLGNLGRAVETLGDCLALELSDAAIEQMPSHIYKKHVEQEFREREEKRPVKTSEKPYGISWSNWIHNR
ncbi:MAG: hypothetical protein WA628_22615 [Terriglobales bacterium]